MFSTEKSCQAINAGRRLDAGENHSGLPFHLSPASSHAFLLFLRSWNIDRDSVNVDKAAAKPARDRQECNRNNRQDDAKSLIVG
ncbi:MAG: hypothetical protein AUI91_00700 [Acidobacteria bacterium 13_1_40CM_3_56_11]|nr:MAG: hypothetical protein AUI91_00700 [Acidobacteria bacterium 13_1_40CM_3_56_11]